MQTIRDLAALRRAVAEVRGRGDRIALVPTMGALHAGHMALVDEARRRADTGVASIFANPMQFGAGEDLARYPRREAEDAAMLEAQGCAILWAPDAATMYPRGFATTISVAGVYVGALDLFQTAPAMLAAEQVAGVTVAAELAQMPVLDLLGQNMYDAAATPGSTGWNELNTLTRAEVSQATGMLMAQLKITAPEALVRLRAHAYSSGRSATEIARDILQRRLRLDPH